MRRRLPGGPTGHSGGVTEVRRTIKARPDDVWAVLADPTTYPDWLIGAQLVRSVDGDFPRPGSDFHHEVGPNKELTLPDSTTAIEAERPRLLALKVRARPFLEAIARFELLEVPDGTELVLGEQPVGPFRFAAPVLRPLVAARNARSLAKLAELVEARSAA